MFNRSNTLLTASLALTASFVALSGTTWAATTETDYAGLSTEFQRASLGAIVPAVRASSGSANYRFELLGGTGPRDLPTWYLRSGNADSAHPLWNWDVGAFLKASSAEYVLDGVRAFYANQAYVPAAGAAARPYAYLNSWGQLFHPPVYSLGANADRVFRPFSEVEPGKNSTFATPEFQSHLDILSGYELTRGNETELLQNGASFRKKLDLVDHASRSILISQLGIACDASSDPMIDALARARGRRLDVRLLVDHLYGVIAKKCLQRYSDAGVRVSIVENPKAKYRPFATTNHTSMWILDETTLIIGAQNINEANNTSDGYNFKDRDTDLLLHGPTVTDAVSEYVEVWNENNPTDRSMAGYAVHVATRRRNETDLKLRGQRNYADWIRNDEPGLCRVAFQRPNRVRTGLSGVLLDSIKHSEHLIEATTTQVQKKLDQKTGSLILEIANALRERAADAKVRTDLIGNGIDGADGELTMALSTLALKQYVAGNEITASIINSLNHRDRFAKGTANHVALRALGASASDGLFQTYEFFNFYHGKQWYFDRTALLVGSMNFDGESFETHYEGAALCMDRTLNAEFERALLLDLVNSVPVIH